MHTVTVLQSWHITLTAGKQKTLRKITLLHRGVMLSSVTSDVASFFGIQGE